MKLLKELNESMGAARGLANIKYTKKEIADATHDMHIDGMVDKKYKPQDITDEQANKFVDAMHKVEKKLDHGDYGDEEAREYENAMHKIVAEILNKG